MLFVLGLGVLIFLTVDVLQTTLGQGGGPMTRVVTGGLWQLALRVTRVRHRHTILAIVGIAITILAVALWIALLWAGWLLIFSADESSVLEAATNLPASLGDRVYYVGFTIFTLGTGDFVPEGTLWQVLTVLASWNGLFIATLSITYLTPIVQANNRKRQVSAYISSLGRSPVDLLITVWNGKDFQELGPHLQVVIPLLAELQQRLLAYPVLHYFHSQNRNEAMAVGVAILDEVFTILDCGLRQDSLLEHGIYRPARSVMSQLLATLESAFITPAGRVPPLPSLDRLRDRGVPLVSDEVFAERAAQLADRRRLLLALVENDGWSWDLLLDRRTEHRDTAW